MTDEPSNRELLLTRRRLLGLAGTAGAATLLAACGGGGSGSPAASPATTAGAPAAAGPATCTITPEETAGPFPLDLHGHSAFFRRDITEGRPGVPLALTLTVLDAACRPLTNARVDVWHTDKDGTYSGFADAVGQTFCRGIQLTDGQGRVTFDTVYPGWYRGRITHVHFQVYPNDGLVATSQLAFPQEVTRVVYASPLYADRGQNTSVPSFAQDGIFGDGVESQMLDLSGSLARGYAGSLVVGVRA